MIMSFGSQEADIGQAGDRRPNSPSNSSSNSEEKEKRLREIRAQIEQIKKQIEDTDGRAQPGTSESRRVRGSERDDVDVDVDIPKAGANSPPTKGNNDLSKSDSFRAPKESKRRQRETIEKVNIFKSKLKQVSKVDKVQTSSVVRELESAVGHKSEEMDDELGGVLDLVDDDSWLRHRFEAKDEPYSEDFELDRGEERSPQRSSNESRQEDEVPRKRHRHDHSGSSYSGNNREPESRDSSRKRDSSSERHHLHHRSHKYRHRDDNRDHHRTSSDRDSRRRRHHH